MKARTSPVWAALVTISCGGGPSALDFEDPGANATDDAGSVSDVSASGPRLLSDVGPPRKMDGRSGNGPAEAAPWVDVGVEADERSTASATDASRAGPGDGGRDASVDARSGNADGGPDASTDVTSPPSLDAGRDIAIEGGDEPDVSAANQDEPAPDHAESSPPPVDASFEEIEERPPVTGAHLVITEVVTRPSGAEMIEIFNPTPAPVALVDYLLSDSHLYYKVATSSFTTASGSDFAARFPEGSSIEPGRYVVVAIANASGGSTSFEAAFGQKPDFELRPNANGASDDPMVPNMQPAQAGSSIGATSSLTDSGEPVILFFYREGPRVFDVDYLFYGTASASNPVIDKTGIEVLGQTYAADTPVTSQHFIAAPDVGSIHRCRRDEPDEVQTGGNGVVGHDETSENTTASFVAAPAAELRTPGGPPPPGLCSP